MVGMEIEAEETMEDPDFYVEDGRVVFTRSFHLRRGICCGSGCRHCPFTPRWTSGATAPTRELSVLSVVEESERS